MLLSLQTLLSCSVESITTYLSLKQKYVAFKPDKYYKLEKKIFFRKYRISKLGCRY